MKFLHYKKRVEESEEFKKFKSKNKGSYLAAGFFVLDFETGKDMHQVDYALPNGKVATFIADEGIKMKISDKTLKKELPEIKAKIKTDIDTLRGIVEDEMKNRTVTEKIKKIIAVLHILDGKVVWNLQCVLDGMSLLNVHVDDSDQSILKFEKHSLMDLIKSAPPGLGMQKPQGETGAGMKKLDEKDLKKLEEELNKLAKKKKNQKKD